VGQETETCGSPEGGTAPPSDSDRTMPGDRAERPAEVLRKGHNGPFCTTVSKLFVDCHIRLFGMHMSFSECI